MSAPNGSGQLLVPLPNDTVSDSYFDMVDARIADVQSRTPAPPVVTTAEPSNYQKVADATIKDPVKAEDLTDEELASMRSVPIVTPGPGLNSKGQPSSEFDRGYEVQVVPWDMKIGAEVLSTIKDDMSTPTPPPSQDLVSAQFVAQCPMIMFGNSLYINAPHCSDHLGSWEDPETHRSVIRWDGAEKGLRFGVDSAVGGNGSATYAKLEQELTIQGFLFSLTNCLGAHRYTIEEQVTKVNYLGRGIESTITEHDISRSAEAFFYKYVIKAPNGSSVAATNLFRLNQDEINITMFNNEVSDGAMVATAKRIGVWTGSGWRTCGASRRSWQVDFKLDSRSFDQVATVMDLRVASAALLTLMAYREESTDISTGVARDGEHSLWKELLLSILISLAVAIVLLLIFMCLKRRLWDVKLRRIFFKLEAALLPKRPQGQRVPPIYNTW